MAKSPIVRDTLLAGEIAVTLVGCPASVHASLYGAQVTAKQLRDLADQLDRFQAARDVFFEMKTEREYAITFAVVGGEDCVTATAKTPTDAVEEAMQSIGLDLKKIRSVYDVEAKEYVSF